MADIKENEGLFDDFPPVSDSKWREKIRKDLKGADFDKKLVWRTNEKFEVKPYYRKEDLKGLEYLENYPGEFPFIRGKGDDNNVWRIRQDVKVINPKEANTIALHAIKNGATSISFIICENVSIDKKLVSRLIEAIDIEHIEINFIAGERSAAIPKLLELYIQENKLNAKNVNGSIDYDPIASLILNGGFHNENFIDELSELLEFVNEKLPAFKVLTIHAEHFHNAGSSIVQELGYSLAVANQYLSLLTDKGVDISEITPFIKFSFAIGSNYFMEIAKLRATRLLWSNIVDAYGVKDKDLAKTYIHAVTSRWNMTIYDPHINMLRATTESMSAIIGGADSLNVVGFDSSYTNPEEFSLRYGRNVQHILKEEAYFDKTIDPAAGSWYIENLTHLVAENAWKAFQDIDKEEGFIKAFKNSIIQNSILRTASLRNIDISTRREILLGTNQFPEFGELMKDNIEELSDASSQINPKNVIATPLKLYRGAEEFEKVRMKTENADKQPIAWMFTYGNLAMRRARSNFAGNFFGCAGFKVVDNIGFETIDRGIEEFVNSGAEILVICSSDDEYEKIVPEILSKVTSETIVVIAGYPKNIIEKIKDIGIEHFIHANSDVLESLQEFQKLLGI